MTDDLSAELRAQGHNAEADSIERKTLAGQLREQGRDDLADRLDGPVDEPEQEPFSGVSLFGNPDEDEIAAVSAALERDLPDWRGAS